MARSDSNGSEPRRPITPTTDTPPSPSTPNPFDPLGSYYEKFGIGGDIVKNRNEYNRWNEGPESNGIATPAAGYDDFSRFLQDWYQQLFTQAGTKTEQRDIMNNFLDYIQLLQKNKFQTEQADLSYLRSSAANQVSLMMAAGMSRSQALAALQGGGESTPMEGGTPTQQANNSPNGAEIANSVFSGIDTAVGIGSLGLSAGMFGAEKGLKMATSRLYGLQYQDMDFKMKAALLGAKVFGCLNSLAINAVGGKTGTPLPKWNPDDEATLPNMIGFIQKGADAGDPSCQSFIDGGYYQQLCENPYGAETALGVLNRWQKGETPDLTRYLAEYERQSKRIGLLSANANVQKTMSEILNIDAHTDLMEQQRLSEEQTTQILASDAKFRNQYNQAQINDLRMSGIHHASSASNLDVQTDFQDMQNTLRHATLGLVSEKEVAELQLLVESWRDLHDDPEEWEKAKREFILRYDNAYFVAAMQNNAYQAQALLWRTNPALAANWSLIQEFNLPDMLEEYWQLGPAKVGRGQSSAKHTPFTWEQYKLPYIVE